MTAPAELSVLDSVPSPRKRTRLGSTSYRSSSRRPAVAAMVYTLCPGPGMRNPVPTTARTLSQDVPVQSHHWRRSTR